jgi:circadian clock protein KaiC
MTTGRDEPSAPGDDQAASTGVEGLDEILRGGFTRDEMHLIRGGSGTGKTTLALQFLLAGARAGERGLYISLAQTKKSFDMLARSHGWSLEGLTVHEVTSDAIAGSMAAHQTVLHTSEVELNELTRELRRVVEQSQPRRAVFDSLGMIGLLAGGVARYHREIASLRQFLTGHGCTTLFLDDWQVGGEPESAPESPFSALATSVVNMEQRVPDYGEVRRRILVSKVRNVAFEGGYHDFRILTGGLEVYSRLEAPEQEYTDFRAIHSGIATLDELLGGGLDLGTTCLFIGQPGMGKSTLASIFARSAVLQGDAAAIFLFDERPETFKERSTALGIDLSPHLTEERIFLQKMDTSSITPGEFAHRVRQAVEGRRVKVVVIDSLTGYFNAMESTTMLVVQMHELLDYLNRNGVLTMLLLSQEGFMTGGGKSAVDVSYLSDSVIVLRMFEMGGDIRRCLSVVKKRQGEHMTSIRELFIRPGEVTVGSEPLRRVRHVLSGEPESIGEDAGPGGNVGGGAF